MNNLSHLIKAGGGQAKRVVRNAPIGGLIPFKEALAALKAKKVVPADMSSEDWSRIDAALRERAFFSARTTNAAYLQRVKELIDEIVDPKEVVRDDGVTVTRGMGQAEARVAMRDMLGDLDYVAPEGKAGGIQDLSSDARLNLIIRTQTDMARGYGQWKQGQTEGALDAFPAWELYRAQDRIEPRDWPARWEEAGGEFYGGDADYPEGRMIALKDDGIWTAISAFGLPYPPFDFNSGMRLRNVPREECVELGMIDENEPVPAAQERDWEKDTLEDVEGLDDDLKGQLLEDLGTGYRIVKGVLRLMNRWLGNAAGEGVPCGEGFIAADKECRIGDATRVAAKVVREHQRKAKAGIPEGEQTIERLKEARKKYNEYLKRNEERRRAERAAGEAPAKPKRAEAEPKEPEKPVSAPPDVAPGTKTRAAAAEVEAVRAKGAELEERKRQALEKVAERAKRIDKGFEQAKAKIDAKEQEAKAKHEERVRAKEIKLEAWQDRHWTPHEPEEVKELKRAIAHDPNPNMVRLEEAGPTAGGANKGVDESWVVKWKAPGGGTYKAIYKPGRSAMQGVRGQIDNREVGNHLRELATYNVGMELGCDMPPVTIANVKGKGDGSVMKWLDNHARGLCPDDSKNAKYAKKIAQYAVLDVFIGNTDRHGNNLMYHKDTGEPKPIDNGLTFPEAVGRMRGNNSEYVRWMGGRLKNDQVPEVESEVKRMFEKIKSPQFRAWSYSMARKVGLKKESIDRAHDRVSEAEKAMRNAQGSYREKWRQIKRTLWG